ncbi:MULTISPECIES: HigA family addiction module antitoxin [Gordonibacter]|uniref:HigA family addiction module antitoxin n=1 Tax=Gordonibacter faecis TaxID=3047475 RepID=A0ABT7DL39_9ACTN|nr:HigA family addiction module antitoxin [Gordonibacter sp. KGMB12511]MDJ1650243.1 HigA family addiction module antitoxin [Gordonibacter sp. KGMB12511]
MSGFIVMPGEVIKEYLDDRGMTQKEVAQRIGVSEKHLSNMLNGKTRLTEDMALKLEKVMPDVPASFWLNYEVKYQEYLAREKEKYDLEGIDLKAISEKFHFKEVFKRTKKPLVEQAIDMLKLLGVTSFERYKAALPLGMEFMQDGGEDEASVVWIKQCEQAVEEQNKQLDDVPFDPQALEESFGRLKNIALNPNVDDSIKSCRKYLNRHGVYLVVVAAIANSKIRGALTTFKGHPAIYISKRFKTHDHVWFTIVHEIGHLLLHYDPSHILVSDEELSSEAHKDREANVFARKFFVNEYDYNSFKNSKNFTAQAISEFAREQGVHPGIIVGFLQHDGEIAFDQMNSLKSK